LLQSLYHISIKKHHTFGIDVKAKELIEIHSLKELIETLAFHNGEKFMFLGEGSNVLFTKDYDGLIIKNRIKGIEIIDETDNDVIIKSYSGENWHQFVMHCIKNNWGGIENLSLIPGTVGAAPMQNIGAYGVELENSFVQLEALNLETMELETFSKEKCQFGYRESVFKRRLKNQYFIFSVSFKLQKKPISHIDYGDIKLRLSECGIEPEKASIKDISDAIIFIRQSKLPDPKVLGNSGSFFKNPTVTKEHFAKLQEKYPDIKGFDQTNGIKIPAAWLIEKRGWKGKRVGNTGSHEKQALVLVNYGQANGPEVWQLAQSIISDISTHFQIDLEPEVNII
jgi:UDP-N-acetylmuramate dehydrogenase